MDEMILALIERDAECVDVDIEGYDDSQFFRDVMALDAVMRLERILN